MSQLYKIECKNWKLKFMAGECFNIQKIDLSLDCSGLTVRHKIHLENEEGKELSLPQSLAFCGFFTLVDTFV